MNELDFMKEALRLASLAANEDEVPVGAVIIREHTIMGIGSNRNIGLHDPSAHAEINAIRDACTYANNYRIPGATLYVTLEPCPMCFCALIQARISRLVFGAADPKGGYRKFLTPSAIAAFNHQIEVTSGMMEEDCRDLLQRFFREKRERGRRKWMKESS